METQHRAIVVTLAEALQVQGAVVLPANWERQIHQRWVEAAQRLGIPVDAIPAQVAFRRNRP
ncbi:hypothetical protein [Sulfobacillus harzensis]|uniref:Uncharacterized protein n=1 Tax=Sulfobacillus harzensis TaxID=2729629 RepID=A0A7Y0Q201_9FIRM|nr:hypothetical protein [Sulfobacillus harzensis]NMP21860.1 hypothetical protein [Sulfobacillus harzensis]